MIESFCIYGLAVGLAILTYKVWTYRAAIIQLQADMTLVLNELTEPHPMKDQSQAHHVPVVSRNAYYLDMSP